MGDTTANTVLIILCSIMLKSYLTEHDFVLFLNYGPIRLEKEDIEGCTLGCSYPGIGKNHRSVIKSALCKEHGIINGICDGI